MLLAFWHTLTTYCSLTRKKSNGVKSHERGGQLTWPFFQITRKSNFFFFNKSIVSLAVGFWFCIVKITYHWCRVHPILAKKIAIQHDTTANCIDRDMLIFSIQQRIFYKAFKSKIGLIAKNYHPVIRAFDGCNNQIKIQRLILNNFQSFFHGDKNIVLGWYFDIDRCAEKFKVALLLKIKMYLLENPVYIYLYIYIYNIHMYTLHTYSKYTIKAIQYK